LRIPIGDDITDNFTHGLSETNVAYDADVVKGCALQGHETRIEEVHANGQMNPRQDADRAHQAANCKPAGKGGTFL